ncbi:hypothetical protein G7Y79_00004g014230 [Physcia stellaris]|nr:hypothetical protein G7Y79_00004g014230 [Physcia stellaris]
MPPTPERKLVRRCSNNDIQAVNYQPAVQIQQQGWGGYKRLDSTALRALNITKPLNRTLNGNESKDLVQGIQNGDYGGVVQGIQDGNTGGGAVQAIQYNGGVYLTASSSSDDCWDGHDHHGGLAAGAIVGIVFGLGLLLVLAVIAIWLKRKRSKKGAQGGRAQAGPGFSEKMKQLAERFQSARKGPEAQEEKDDVPGTHASASDPYMHKRGY